MDAADAQAAVPATSRKRGRLRELADDSFTPEKVGGELAYLDRPSSRGFERPYGWAWLLYLHLEATRHEQRLGRAASSHSPALLPIGCVDYLEVLTYPIRVGTHFNTAFALTLSLEWAEAFDPPLAHQIRDRALPLVRRRPRLPGVGAGRRRVPVIGAHRSLVHRADRTGADFPQWFGHFLPRVGTASRQFVHACDRQRPQRREDRPSRRHSTSAAPGAGAASRRCFRRAQRAVADSDAAASILQRRCRTFRAIIWASTGSRASPCSRCWRKGRDMADTQALSAEFRKYDQVEKAHTYRLAEHASDQFDDDYEIATLDIAPFLTAMPSPRRFRQSLCVGAGRDRLCRAGRARDRCLALRRDGCEVLELFESTPLEQKMRFAAERYGSVAQGYFPIEQTSEIHPDLVEGWVFCRRAFDIPQQRDAAFCAEDFWPRQEFERQFRRLILAHEQLFKPIAQAMLQGLGCDPHLLDEKLTGTNFGLRLNYYPPMSEAQDRSGAAGCSGMRTSTCSRSCRRRASTVCRCGITAAASGCG